MGFFDALFKPNTMKEFIFEHMSGVPFVNQNAVLNLLVEDKLLLTQGKKENQKVFAQIEYKDIADVVVLQEIENSEQNKSVLGRAVVGGLLLGPVGAVVGGMTGVGTKSKTNTLFYLQIKTNDGKDIILKPFMNSSNISNLAKDRIVEMVQKQI